MINQSFIDIATNEEIILPVAPSAWQWTDGNSVAAVNMHAFGSVNLPTKRSQATETVKGFFPAVGKNYQFANVATKDPLIYIDWFSTRAKSGAVLRYIVSPNFVNKLVLISSFAYGQEGGSGDINYTLTLKEYELPPVPKQEVFTVELEERSAPLADNPTYTVVKGDTLWALCKRFYGQTSMDLCRKVAFDNNIKNANLIYVGQVINFPPIDTLSGGMSVQSKSTAVQMSEEVKVSVAPKQQIQDVEVSL